MVEQELNVILSINIGCGPKHMLLGIYDDIIVDKHKNTLCNILCNKMYPFEVVNGQSPFKGTMAQGYT